MSNQERRGAYQERGKNPRTRGSRTHKSQAYDWVRGGRSMKYVRDYLKAHLPGEDLQPDLDEMNVDPNPQEIDENEV